MAALDPRVQPRVHERDGFVVTLWTYHEPTTSPVAPADYADALALLHAGMRTVDVAVPSAGDRVESAQRLLADRALTPGLGEPDRELLRDVLRQTGRSVAASGRDQLLHGEPHPGNVLSTSSGPVFIDFETVCRGPVEFDLAHAPEEVDPFYPGADPVLLEDCRLLVLAMVTTWRWDVGDQFPDGHRMGVEWLGRVRVGAAERARRGRR
ncbi:aminoglycoside phosphotransferase family protein [Auraticoccus monumenti]|uniref:aminoglycoside phosphotransferase family protein n=1 Tax=Auraticoccus monumenti TaxID=675864 RepID=UPI0018D45700|nr:aminoglycoside phosphotransferase family protein [Auraticoccus monumenti]